MICERCQRRQHNAQEQGGSHDAVTYMCCTFRSTSPSAQVQPVQRVDSHFGVDGEGARDDMLWPITYLLLPVTVTTKTAG
eukprot:15483785-Alexandrium_andersonii.AAC.1